MVGRSARLGLVLLCLVAAQPMPSMATSAPAHVTFAVIGDFGTGTTGQYDMARVMAAERAQLGYDLVLTVGDNIYGGWNRRAAVQLFELPYRPLLDAGVSFFATLGNHDASQERNYPLFNMRGERYYSFRQSDVEFFALDSNYLDPPQLVWLRRALAASAASWKIAFFHHPLYSSGERHGSEADLRSLLEPLLVEYGVQVVFSGHDHVYERIKPQKGIAYFVCGSSGQLRQGNLKKSSTLTAAGFDRDQAFLVAAIDGDRLQFTAISRADVVVDSGVIVR
jgi:predicted MPP superfamily phosphohydrolase